MAFLFKSSKGKQSGLPQASRNLQSADGTQSAASGSYRDAERQRNAANAPPNPPFAQSPGSNAPDSPGQRTMRDRSNSDIPTQIPRSLNTPPPAQHQQHQLQQRQGDMSLFPWSKRGVDLVNPQQSPFPRYGAAINALASKEGEIYMMGGLINGTTVKGDLWICEASASNDPRCYIVPTTAEGPGPRVGHASLLVGNAFIVFGGDTKIDEGDVLDDTLYLLNTSSKHWSRAIPSGARPQGRYGHTLNIIGTRIFIFGGQVENYFFNDLVTFDLNSLQSPNNRWETLVRNSSEGGPPAGQIPFARTNHSIVSYNEKLYLFGGTDGVRWFNDVWAYDARTNTWEAQECIGFIPVAREGHAAAIVDDVMYVFGGRNDDGKDLNDLTAFRIPTRRWYTFQNMGPAPSPRSGHGMTAVGKNIYIIGGEPSSAPRDSAELGLAYILDTSKIRYPAADKAPPQQVKTSLEGNRVGAPPPQQALTNGRLQAQESSDSMNSLQAQQEGSAGHTYGGSRMSGRGAPGPPPPQQQPPQPRMNGMNGVNGMRTVATEGGRESPRPAQQQRPDRIRSQDQAQPSYVREPPRVSSRDISKETSAIPVRQRATSVAQQQAPQIQPVSQSTFSHSAVQPMSQQPEPAQPHPVPHTQQPPQTQTPQSQLTGQQRIIDDIPVTQLEGNSRVSLDYTADRSQQMTPQQQPASTQQQRAAQHMPSSSKSEQPVDSGVGSSPSLSLQQQDDLLEKLEAIRSQNAWYASELSLAKKSGYRTGSDSPAFDERSTASVSDSDKPLLEALLRVRAELVQTQQSMQVQTDETAERIAFLEKQRDAAINEAVYAKTTSASRGEDRSRDAASDERLASALATHSDLTARLKSLNLELEGERKAREHAEQSANAAHARATELDSHKQQSSSEVEKLRMQVHEVQKAHRQEAANAHEAQSALKSLEMQHMDLNSRWTAQQDATQHHAAIMDTLRTAVTTSSEKSEMLLKELGDERQQHMALRSEHDIRLSELQALQKRLEQAESLAASHAEEARTHREAVLAGFGKTDIASRHTSDADQRVAAMQQQLDAANLLVRKNQEAADQAADRLRSAEERIAGLEVYQEQASREGLTMRKQLQQASSDAAAHHVKHTDVQQKLVNKELEHSALQTQFSMLSSLLEEQGIDTANLSESRGERTRELEEQLEEIVKEHEELRASFAEREREANRGWEEKLAKLDADYQSAVKYLKGTEKMLSKMKQELHRYKTQNKELEEELASNIKDAPSAWEAERAALKKEVEDMQAHLDASKSELDKQMDEVHSANAARDYLQKQLDSANHESRASLDNLRTQNNALEARATEAERKVQILLETVGTSVNNYRRESQLMQANGGRNSMQSASHSRGPSVNSVGGGSSVLDGAVEEHPGARNSMALDNLANELETLRSHWESTNKGHRLSDKSDIERASMDGPSTPPMSDGLANWRRKLDLEQSPPQ